MMKRELTPAVKEAVQQKITLITGPRQCGKTTLAKSLTPHFEYFNYDATEDRVVLKEKSWDRDKALIIFDELHKMKKWKQWLKGVYDKESIPPGLLVTGSAQLNTYKKVGDSLAGRYFQYRLHPFDLREYLAIDPHANSEIVFNQLMHCGGFPEPFLKGSESFYRIWRRTHLDIILRQDIIDLHSVRDIQSIETLVELLRTRVGSGISYANLARDLERDPTTIKRWLQLLENMYVIFRVNPYHKNISRALLKEPKYYFFDIAQVKDRAARLENLVALSLLKKAHYLEDTLGYDIKINYLRTKDGKEIDFVIHIDDVPVYLLEIKSSDCSPANAFNYFKPYFPHARLLQLVEKCEREKTFANGLAVRALLPWLVHCDFEIK